MTQKLFHRPETDPFRPERMINPDAMEASRVAVPFQVSDHPSDNQDLRRLVDKLNTLRYDSRSHGELLATLCLPQNRAAIVAGKKEDIDQLFGLIDTWYEGHKHRMAGIDGP